MTTIQFWFDGEQFVLNDDLWGEFNERWPEDVEKPNAEVAEQIVREIAEPVGEEAAA